MKEKRRIKNIVKIILQENPKARNSDRYLYVEVVKKVNPGLEKLPLSIALADAEIPCMETVRRSRQFIQAKFPSLRATDVVEEFRKEKEEEYREVFSK